MKISLISLLSDSKMVEIAQCDIIITGGGPRTPSPLTSMKAKSYVPFSPFADIFSGDVERYLNIIISIVRVIFPDDMFAQQINTY